MKKIISKILIISMLFLGVGGFLAIPETAQAACSIGEVTVGNGLTDCIFEGVVAVVMPIIAKFLQLTAYLFDHALTLNMNIAQFLQQPTCVDKGCEYSPVEVVWRLIRDISGMFFIFILVFSSIKMILSGEKNQGVIVGVIIAGLLVNFSLFATKIIIDASNTLTLTIYTAISPTQAGVTLGESTTGGLYKNNANDIYGKAGTVSSKIMQVVDLQSLFASTQSASKSSSFTVTGIVTVIGGASLMLVLGLAFLAAGVMFLWRFIMLLALMAASPIPALAYAFPGLRGGSNWFFKELMAQCAFAPIFLFALYIALKVLTSGAFIALADSKNSSFANLFSGVGGGIAPLIQYGLVIGIIFGGLILAKTAGGKGGEFGINGIKTLGKWGQGAIRGATMGTVSAVGRNTIGQASKDFGKTFDKLESRVANSPLKFMANNSLTRGISGGLKAGANAKYGGSQSLEDIDKEGKERGKKLREVQLVTDLKSAVSEKDETKVKAALDKMTDAEIAKLDKKTLTNSVVMKNISKGVHSAVDKGDKSDAEKMAIVEARNEQFTDIVKKADPAVPDTMKALKNMVESYDKEDYKKVVEAALTEELGKTTPSGDVIKRLIKNVDGEDISEIDRGILTNYEFARHLTSSHLKKMEFLDDTTRRTVGNHIYHDATNVAYGYVDKNSATWL